MEKTTPTQPNGKFLTQGQIQDLEALVDQAGITEVLDQLMVICYEKEDHVQTNWQDEKLARYWGWIGRRISTFTDNIRKYGAK